MYFGPKTKVHNKTNLVKLVHMHLHQKAKANAQTKSNLSLQHQNPLSYYKCGGPLAVLEWNVISMAWIPPKK